MKRITENKIVLVWRNTRLDGLIKRFNTLSQAKFYVEHLGAEFSDYLDEHEKYYKVLEEAKQSLSGMGRIHVLDREYLPNFIFADNDIVVAVGQDGLVANTLKYLENQPVIGVNPDRKRWDGVLLPFDAEDLPLIIPEVFSGLRDIREVTMAEAVLNDGQRLLAVNDLFIGPKSHTSARYILKYGNMEERQSSSGVIVSTGLGSSAWLKSIIAGSAGIYNSSSSKKKMKPLEIKISWDSNELIYSVREPFPSVASSTELVFGRIKKKTSLRILSQMPEGGVIFSDGIEKDFINFNSGVEAVIRAADKKGHIVV